MEQFSAHNLHWQSVDLFFHQDPQLYRLQQYPLIHENILLEELPLEMPGIYTLGGGRQIGKTTLLKQWMKRLLQQGINPHHIAFLTGEMIVDHLQLVHLLQEYMSRHESGARYYLIIDEITYIKHWDQGIKYLADVGAFENAVVLLTGSDMRVMKEARMRFPGRRGRAEQVDFHLHPLSFYECVQLKHPSLNHWSADFLHQEFEDYLKHGGFLTSMNDWVKDKTVSPSTYRTYSDWIRGDILNSGKKENNLREVLTSLLNTYGTQVSWNSLCHHTAIQHPDSIRDYVETLESMDVVLVQHALIEDKLMAAPKKAKKILFKDPFIYHAVRSWILPFKEPHDDITPLLAESCVVSQFHRFYPCFYIKAEGEVDLAYIDDEHFFPIEVKWTSQIRQKDLKQVRKYPNALIFSKQKEEGLIGNIPVYHLPSYLFQTYVQKRLEETLQKPQSHELQKMILTKILKAAYKKRITTDIEAECIVSSIQSISGIHKLEKPTIGCLAVYFDEKKESGLFQLVGRVVQIDPEIIVVSKWQPSHVILEHPWWFTPYGRNVFYYRG